MFKIVLCAFALGQGEPFPTRGLASRIGRFTPPPGADRLRRQTLTVDAHMIHDRETACRLCHGL